MVTSVQPQYTPPMPSLAAGVQTRPQPQDAPAARTDVRGDSVELGSYSKQIGAARDALGVATTQLDLALAAGRDGVNLVSQLRDLARGAIGADADQRAAASAQFSALLAQYDDVISSAIGAGAGLLEGEALHVSADPGAPAFEIAGYDLRLKDEAGADDVLRLTTGSSLDSDEAARAAARDADASLARLDAALSKLSGASQRLAAHDNFLGALDSAVSQGIVVDIDAEGARLTALQVRQTLAGTDSAIANSTPTSLLALFREA